MDGSSARRMDPEQYDCLLRSGLHNPHIARARTYSNMVARFELAYSNKADEVTAHTQHTVTAEARILVCGVLSSKRCGVRIKMRLDRAHNNSW